jgi:hypothetical protein
LGAILKIFGDPLYYYGLFTNFEASLLSGSVNFLETFFKLVERKYFGISVRDLWRILGVNRDENLGFIFMQKTLFPEIY